MEARQHCADLRESPMRFAIFLFPLSLALPLHARSGPQIDHAVRIANGDRASAALTRP